MIWTRVDTHAENYVREDGWQVHKVEDFWIAAFDRCVVEQAFETSTAAMAWVDGDPGARIFVSFTQEAK